MSAAALSLVPYVPPTTTPAAAWDAMRSRERDDAAVVTVRDHIVGVQRAVADLLPHSLSYLRSSIENYDSTLLAIGLFYELTFRSRIHRSASIGNELTATTTSYGISHRSWLILTLLCAIPYTSAGSSYFPLILNFLTIQRTKSTLGRFWNILIKFIFSQPRTTATTSMSFPQVFNLADFICSVQSIIYCLNHSYISTADRFANARVTTTKRAVDVSVNPYTVLAYMQVCTITINALTSFVKFAVSQNEDVEVQESDIDTVSDSESTSNASVHCNICLHTLTNSCAALCGHVYCWNCLCSALQQKPECPTCRIKTNFNEIIPLKNY